MDGLDRIHILLIEPHGEWQYEVQKFMESQGCICTGYSHYRINEVIVANGEIDCLVINISSDFFPGTDWLEQFRNNSIVLMSHMPKSREDKMLFFDHGADEYLTVPCDLEELYIRIQSLVRKRRGKKGQILQLVDLKFDLSRKTISANEISLKFTRKEYEILLYLVTHKDKVVEREMLGKACFPGVGKSIDAILSVHISRIKKKLRDANSRVGISNLYGVGYRIDIIA